MRSALLVLAVLVAAAGPAGCARPASSPTLPARPPVTAAAKAARSFGPASVDAALRDAWARARVVPAERADDATFLRRVHLDVVGTIPSADAVTAFLASTAPDKRRRLVDELVASPAYAEHWAAYWDDVLMGRTARAGNGVDRGAFRDWLGARFAAGAPWDAIVRDLVAATGRNSAGGGDDDAPVNGAVNWTLRYAQTPQDLAGSASRVFLGVQIQCAQCHDHKTEGWKQDDFRGLASAFLRTRVEPIDRGKVMGAIRRIEVSDLDRVAPRWAKNADLAPLARVRPRALDGRDLEQGKATRKALAEWMTSKENPWFAKAFVNRMWGHFLGRGFVDPVDDLRPGNPAVLPDLLDQLTADFVAHGFDPRHLIRTVCATEAYQLAASAEARPGSPDNELWARFHLVPLGPEELLNAVLRATRVDEAAQVAGVRDIEQLRANLSKQYGFLFDVDEEDDTPDYDGTITGALALLNGALVDSASRAVPGTALAEVLASRGTDAEKIERLALQVLSRRPTPAERDAWVAYVTDPARAPAPRPPQAVATRGRRGGAGLARLARLPARGRADDPKRAAYEELVWAWLQASEFVFNH